MQHTILAVNAQALEQMLKPGRRTTSVGPLGCFGSKES